MRAGRVLGALVVALSTAALTPQALAQDAAAPATASAADGAAPALTLSGRVLDAGQQPLAGVVVILGAGRADLNGKAWRVARGDLEKIDERALSGADGRFELTLAEGALPAADERVLAELRVVLLHPQHATRLVRTARPPGDVAPHFDLGDLPMEPGASLTGRVVNERGGVVPNADVFLENPAPTAQAPAVAESPGDEPLRQLFLMGRSAEDGRFAVHGLRPGVAHLRVSLPDVAETRVRELRVDAREPLDAGDVVLSWGHEVIGVVVDEDGQPIRHARVQVQRPRTDGVREGLPSVHHATGSSAETRAVTVTDAEGRFRARKLAAGIYDVHVSAQGRAWSRVYGVEADSGELRIVMPGLGTLLVTVLADDTSAPIEGATLEAMLPPAERSQPWSNAQYRISTQDQPPGRYAVIGAGPEGTELTVRAAGYVELTQLLPAVPAQQVVELVLRLRPQPAEGD